MCLWIKILEVVPHICMLCTNENNTKYWKGFICNLKSCNWWNFLHREYWLIDLIFICGPSPIRFSTVLSLLLIVCRNGQFLTKIDDRKYRTCMCVFWNNLLGCTREYTCGVVGSFTCSDRGLDAALFGMHYWSCAKVCPSIWKYDVQICHSECLTRILLHTCVLLLQTGCAFSEQCTNVWLTQIKSTGPT